MPTREVCNLIVPVSTKEKKEQATVVGSYVPQKILDTHKFSPNLKMIKSIKLRNKSTKRILKKPNFKTK